MTDHILIDGWNVCWKIPEIASFIPHRLRDARARFSQWVQGYFQNKKTYYRIIYDGQPGISYQNQKDHGKIRFSTKPEDADQLIIKIIKKQKNPRQWTVVTSDKELAMTIKSLDSNVISAEEFISKISRLPRNSSEPALKEQPKLLDEDIEYWMKKFNQR